MNKQTIKTATTKLTRELKQAGVDLPHNQILEMVAHSFGYKNYNTLLGSINSANKMEYSNKEKESEKIQRAICIEVLLDKVIYFDNHDKKDIYDKLVDLWKDCCKRYSFEKANITTSIDREQKIILIDFSKHKQDFSKPVAGSNNGYMFFMMSFMDMLKTHVLKNAISDIRFIESIQTETNCSMMNCL